MGSKLTFDDVACACSDRRQCFKGRVEDWSLLEWAGSLCGEAGELANFAKKAKRKDGGYTEEMGKELADVLIYAFLIAEELGVDPAECVVQKFNEVSDGVDKINVNDPDIPKAPRLSVGYAEWTR